MADRQGSTAFPPPGEWRPGDLSPAEAISHEDYHARRDILSSSRLGLFMWGEDKRGPGPDAGAEAFRRYYVDREEAPPPLETQPVIIGKLLDRWRRADAAYRALDTPAVLWPPAPTACGVIPVDARRGSRDFEMLPRLVRRLADAYPEGWTFPPKPELVEVAVGPTKGRGTKGHAAHVARTEDPEDEIHGFLPVTPDEWAEAVRFAGEFLAADPGAWAQAPAPMIVKAEEWATAISAARSIVEPEPGNVQAERVRRLLLESGAAVEYAIGWKEKIAIREEDLICPHCSVALFYPPSVPGDDSSSANAWMCPGCGEDFAFDDADEGGATWELDCQAMIDFLPVLGGYPIVGEVKTTRHPMPAPEGHRYGPTFDADFRAFHYGEQVAFYRRGLRKAWGLDWTPPVRLVVVGNAPPHHPNERRIDPEALDRAEETIEAGLYALALRLAGLVPWIPKDLTRAELPPITD